MACGCEKKSEKKGTTVALRCIDPAGCAFNPWGVRGYDETYETVGYSTACLMLESWPHRLELVAEETEILEE